MVNIEDFIAEAVKMKVELQGLNDQAPELVAEIEKKKPNKKHPLSIYEAQGYWIQMNKLIDHTQKIKRCEEKIEVKLEALRLPLSLIKHDIEYVYMGDSGRGTTTSKWLISFDESENKATIKRI